MSTTVRSLKEVMAPGEALPANDWQLRAIQSEECLSFVAWNTRTREAILVDPKIEDIEAYRALARELSGFVWIAVVDTHTHADHISAGAQVSEELHAPYVMHRNAPSPRVHLRVSRDTVLPATAAPVRMLDTPGHTQDSVTVIWGPFLFGGDTLLFGDTGRDDLPGGSPELHFESMTKIKACAKPEMVLLPGHDHKGGRASTWATQLKVNASLTQSREDFVREAAAFSAPAPKLLKEALKENFK